MSERTVVPPRGLGNWRWILPLILVLVIAGIILGVYFGTHKSSSAGSHAATSTRTPTVVPSPTATLLPTATAPPAGGAGTSKPSPTPAKPPAPTPTPKLASGGAAATSSPRPAPTATRKPAPSPTPKPTIAPTSNVKLGTFTYKQSTLQTIQNGADSGDASYAFYLDPFKVVQKLLPRNYGFTAGPVTIVAPPQPPQATPTPYTDSQGLPAVKLSVQYQGKRYVVVLDQPETQGPTGIWVITQISAA
jgi:hypothetical protein